MSPALRPFSSCILKVRYRLIPTFGSFVLRVRCRYCIFCVSNEDVSVPLLGTNFIETPEISGVRSIVHAALFLTFFYLGFIRNWKG